jgi:hypothetical protein
MVLYQARRSALLQPMIHPVTLRQLTELRRPRPKR